MILNYVERVVSQIEDPALPPLNRFSGSHARGVKCTRSSKHTHKHAQFLLLPVATSFLAFCSSPFYLSFCPFFLFSPVLSLELAVEQGVGSRE